MSNIQSQNRAILAYFEQGGSLTEKDAERLFGRARIGAHIKDSRDDRADAHQYDRDTLISMMEKSDGRNTPAVGRSRRA